MPKTRMTALDIRAIVSELRYKILGTKVVNVYDVASKTYIIRLSSSKIKTNLLIESGIRVYLTEYARDKMNQPSGFILKVRKHIRNKRIDAIRQVSFDRVIDIAFGMGENTVHLVLELYAGGNVILTDCRYHILALLRPYKLNDGTLVAVKQVYDIQPKQHDPFLDLPSVSALDVYSYLYGDQQTRSLNHTGSLLKLLAGFPQLSLLPPTIIEQALQLSNIRGNLDISEENITTEQISLFLSHVCNLGASLATEAYHAKGYLHFSGEEEEKGKLYDDYAPVKEIIGESENIEEFPSFSKGLDAFYTLFDQQKNEKKEEKERQNVNSKVQKIRDDQLGRINLLKEDENDCLLKAELIQYNIYIIDIIIIYLNKLLSSGMSWDDISIYIEEQKEMGNYIYTYINSLHLDHSYITIYIYDEDQNGQYIDIYVDRNAYMNVEKYYQRKKEITVKRIKTEEAAEQTIKQAQEQAELSISRQVQSVLYKERPKKWFEKYNWFITKDRYLCISGRDMIQNEQIVKKYLRPQDIYIHADIIGASSVVIRNKYTDKQIPFYVIEECASFAVCYSTAWEHNVPVNAYYVYPNQVSKSAPTGEYLPTGSFMIRGKKNYIPVSKMEMGFGYLFMVSEDSVHNHESELKGREIDDITAGGMVPSESLEESGEISIEVDTYGDSVDASSIPENNQETEEVEVEGEEEKKEKEEKKEEKEKTFELGSNDDKKEIPIENEEEKDEEDNMNKPMNGKKRISAKERKMMKKAKELGVSIEDVKQRSQPQVVKEKVTVSAPAPKRGQRNKNKKNKKGQNMDDDDDEYTMYIYIYIYKYIIQLLYGSNSSKEENSKEKKKSPNNHKNMHISNKNNDNKSIKNNKQEEVKQQIIPSEEKEKENEEEKEEEMGPFCYSCGSTSHIQVDCPYRFIQPEEIAYFDINTSSSNTEEDNENNTKEENDNDNNEDEEEEIDEEEEEEEKKKKEEEEKIKKEQEEEEEKKEFEESKEEDQNLIQTWFPHPIPDDELLYCIPVCAPYSTLVDYKFKVKLLPGKSKKGKILKDISEMFKKIASQKEKEVMKTLSTDICMTIIKNNSKLGIFTNKKKK
ncbi:hypothetical protein WA158_002300 [Blastocystis sp. Blastoise]